MKEQGPSNTALEHGPVADRTEDMDATLPSSQYSERGELLIPSTIVIRRLKEAEEEDARVGAIHGLLADAPVAYRTPIAQVTERPDWVMESDGGAMEMGVDQPQDVARSATREVPCQISSPLPPSSLCFEMQHASSPINNHEDRHLIGNSLALASSPSGPPEAQGDIPASMEEDMMGGDEDEFDDPWFDAACLAEVDEGDSVDGAGAVGELPGATSGEVNAHHNRHEVAGLAGLSIPGEQSFDRVGGAHGSTGISGNAPLLPHDSDEDMFDKLDENGFDDLIQFAALPYSGNNQHMSDNFDPFAEVGGYYEPGELYAPVGELGIGGTGGMAAGGGFSTAKGKKVAPPSAAAAARALKLFETEVIEDVDEATFAPPVVVAAPSVASGPSACVAAAESSSGQLSRKDLASASLEQGGARLRPSGISTGGSMFATANGNKLSGPSVAAYIKIAQLFADGEGLGEAASSGANDCGNALYRPPLVRRSMFATAGGNALPPPTEAASDRVSKLFLDAADPQADSTVQKSNGMLIVVPTDDAGLKETDELCVEKSVEVRKSERTSGTGAKGGDKDLSDTRSDVVEFPAPHIGTARPRSTPSPFATANGSALKPVSESARAQADAMFAEEVLPESPQPTRTTGHSTPLRDATNTPRKTSFRSPVMHSSKPYTRPDTTPLKHSAGFTPAPALVTKPSPILAKRVGIGLGMTPRARNNLATRPKFNSPLRKMADNSPVTPSKAGRNHAASLLGPALRDRKASAAIPTEPSCFDLNTRPLRQDMLASHLHPRYFSVNELMDMDIPEEIWAVNPTNAGFYQFEVADALKGAVEATTELHAAGCLRATTQWVREHWTMILWKLASIVRAKPELCAEKWTYHEVIRQLLYRYEREMNLAQRSAIKRIQEQDSSPSLPMVLCVSAIMHPEKERDEEGKDIATHPILELTDGWYRIQATTDAALGRAIKAGRLQVGYKISIMGARLDATREGTEVLNALDKSRLIIGGNSTSMAVWSAKLGFSRRPFIASLPSLTHDGGLVSIMNIRVAKVFPLAYMSAKRDENFAPWSAAEEFTQQDLWKETYSQERIRLTQELQTRIALLEDELSQVAAASEGILEDVDADAGGDDEEALDTFRQAGNKASYLRSLRPPLLAATLTALQREYRFECAQGVQDIEAQMQLLCPVRDTRSFQVIRFEDTHVYQKERCRLGQLQVWDAHTLGDGALVEGMRFMINNLVPAQPHSWCGPRDHGVVYLSTKRDTVWRRMEAS